MNIEMIKKAADAAFVDYGKFLIEIRADINAVVAKYIECDNKLSKIDNYLESYEYEYLSNYVDMLRRYIADQKVQEVGYIRDREGQWIENKELV